MSRLLGAVVSSCLILAGCGPGASNGEPPKPVTFEVKLENHAPWQFLKSGVFNTPVGKTAPGPIKTGDAYEFTFTAGKAHRLSFAMMFGASNDWFYGTGPEGIALYENGIAVSGDVTSQLHLYNAGTEIDQEPGVGADVGPNQSAPDQGAPDTVNQVRELVNPISLADGSTFNMPAVSSVLKVTLSPTTNDREFKVRIENISGMLTTSAGDKAIGLSPGVFVIHGGSNPLYTLGQPDRGEGLELIAESGRVQTLADAVSANAGVATGFSPGVYVLSEKGEPLFTLDSADRGQGLENLAESGNVQVLSDALNAKLPEGAKKVSVFNLPDGATSPGPIGPGKSYTFTVEAMPGEKLSFASMFGASNDWVVATPPSGIALFDMNGKPLSGDHTADLAFYDVGSEADEELAVGAHTGPNQSSPTDGPADATMKVRKVTADRYARSASEHLMLTITAK